MGSDAIELMGTGQTTAHRSGLAKAGKEPGNRAPQSILVVEDDDDVRELVADILEEENFRVFLAANAHAALQILKREPGIDLLFTDILMPGGINGSELAQAAMTLRPELKVLLASGYIGPELLRPVSLLSETTFIRKPYRPRDLVQRIRALLAG